MSEDHLSKRQMRALEHAMARVVMTQFPNPERRGCPGATVLRSIATKRISMRDPAITHVGACSPCFRELTAMRGTIFRRKVLWLVGAVIAVAIVAVLTGHFV
jgi:aminoglycoside phosphotransferase